MSSFSSSTHSLHWRVTVDEQRSRRLKSYVKYMKARESNSIVEVCTSPNGISADQKEVVVDQTATVDEKTREVVVQQGEVVLQYFCEVIRHDCGPGEDCAVKTSWRLPNTAVVFFRRFYLHNSLFAHDPRVILVACLLLAGKIEEEFVAPAQLVKHIHQALTDVQLQAAEEVVLQGLGYELQVYHPHTCMHALLADIKARQGVSSASTRQWIDLAEPLLTKLQNTEVCLSGLPMSTAVAALLATEPVPPVAAGFSLADYLQEILDGDIAYQSLMTEVAALQPYIEQEECAQEQLKACLKHLSSNAAWSVKKDKKKKDKKKATPVDVSSSGS